jgi:hypothetical protein
MFVLYLSHAGDLRVGPPLQLRVHCKKGLFVVKHPPLGIHVYATSMDRLWVELKEEICFLWRNYAQASPDILSPDALILRQRLLTLLHRR